jgi:hypothetical protein
MDDIYIEGYESHTRYIHVLNVLTVIQFFLEEETRSIYRGGIENWLSGALCDELSFLHPLSLCPPNHHRPHLLLPLPG